MSNHYHVVLHVDRERAQDWTMREVAERWTQRKRLINHTLSRSVAFVKNTFGISIEGSNNEATADKQATVLA